MTEANAQRIAARVAGFLYLATMAASVFAEFRIFSGLMVADAAATARNLIQNEPLFRLGVFLDIATFVGVVPLSVALFVVLRPVGRHLAVLALAWRLIEASIVGVVGVTALMALQAAPFDPALMRLFLRAHGAGYSIGLISYSLGSTLFCALLFKSRYVPRLLSAWGVLAGLAMITCAAGFVLMPAAVAPLRMTAYGLSGGFEVVLGVWLLLFGIRISSVATVVEGAR